MADGGFTIGRLSQDTGVNIETIRYYERIGLLAKPPRTSGGRRLYDAQAVRHFSFVRRARELGFSIEDIRALLALSSSEVKCRDIQQLTVRHLSDIRAKISDLRRLERRLSQAAKGCEKSDPGSCSVIEALTTRFDDV